MIQIVSVFVCINVWGGESDSDCVFVCINVWGGESDSDCVFVCINVWGGESDSDCECVIPSPTLPGCLCSA